MLKIQFKCYLKLQLINNWQPLQTSSSNDKNQHLVREAVSLPVTQSWSWGNQTINKYILYGRFARGFSDFIKMEFFWTLKQRKSHVFTVMVLLLPIFLEDRSQSGGIVAKKCKIFWKVLVSPVLSKRSNNG